MTLGDFTPQADAYARSRPGYPAVLIEQLVQAADVKPGDPVADFGAGTGILTRILVDRQFRVTAIEPNAAMRDQARVPEARWISGTFESSQLDKASQRWAVAAQSFHWADPARALPELARILEPGGLFSVLWNRRVSDAGGIVDWTEAAIQRHVPGFEQQDRDPGQWGQLLESTGEFVCVQQIEVRHLVTMPAGRYLDLWRSNNRLTTLAGQERFGRFLTELGEHLRGQGVAQVEVPYVCQAWSAQSRVSA